MNNTEDIRFVPLPALPGRVYADMVRGALEDQGIPCYIRSDGIMDTLGVAGTGPVNKGFRVFVPEDALDTCRQIQEGMMDHI